MPFRIDPDLGQRIPPRPEPDHHRFHITINDIILRQVDPHGLSASPNKQVLLHAPAIDHLEPLTTTTERVHRIRRERPALMRADLMG
ncbi:MAG: hypothetical protein R2811_16070 [Flavobacteriales bacterium]